VSVPLLILWIDGAKKVGMRQFKDIHWIAPIGGLELRMRGGSRQFAFAAKWKWLSIRLREESGSPRNCKTFGMFQNLVVSPKKIRLQVFASSQTNSRIDESMQIKKVRMQCMEILGGNLKTDKAYEAAGLDIYIHSNPYRASQVGGGDVYYVTSCASGRISRLLLADISGHGEEAASVAASLKVLLKKNITRISQSGFVQQMNREFLSVSPEDRFATAVVATYFEPQKRLALGMAGHPNPLLYRVAEKLWYKVDENLANEEPRFQNMPFGTADESVYPTRNFHVDSGDMFLLYSDAFIESINLESNMLGIDGVLDVLNDMESLAPDSIIPILLDKIGSMSASNLNEDDATLILGVFTDSKPGVRNSLAAPFRLLGPVTDSTQVGPTCKSC
jgi:sigma-B regulation protein RsbU (phosphoserine phosphatase)